MGVLSRKSIFLNLSSNYKSQEKKLEQLLEKVSIFRMQSSASELLNADNTVSKSTNEIAADGGKNVSLRRTLFGNFPFMAKLWESFNLSNFFTTLFLFLLYI